MSIIVPTSISGPLISSRSRAARRAVFVPVDDEELVGVVGSSSKRRR